MGSRVNGVRSIMVWHRLRTFLVISALSGGAGCAVEREGTSGAIGGDRGNVIVKGMAMREVWRVLKRHGVPVREYFDASAAPGDRPAQKLVVESAGTADALVLFGWSAPFRAKKLREIYWHIDFANDGGPKAFRKNRFERVERLSVGAIKERLRLSPTVEASSFGRPRNAGRRKGQLSMVADVSSHAAPGSTSEPEGVL